MIPQPKDGVIASSNRAAVHIMRVDSGGHMEIVGKAFVTLPGVGRAPRQVRREGALANRTEKSGGMLGNRPSAGKAG